jgi:hypothetical protein
MRPGLEARHLALACAVIKKMGELLAQLSSAVMDSKVINLHFLNLTHLDY